MKLVALFVLCTLINNFVQSAPVSSALTEELDGAKPKYLLMSVGSEYTKDRKLKWMIVYKNMVKKECIFREIDSSTADTLIIAALNLQKKTSKFPSHLEGLLIVDDTNISSFCDGFSTRFWPDSTTSNSTSVPKENS